MHSKEKAIVEGIVILIDLNLDKATIDVSRSGEHAPPVELVFKGGDFVVYDHRIRSRDAFKSGKDFFSGYFPEVPCKGSFQEHKHKHKKKQSLILADLCDSSIQTNDKELVLTDRSCHKSTHQIAGNGGEAINMATGIRILCSKGQ